MKFLRDTRHLWILFILVVGGAAGAVWVRDVMVPKSYGKQGPYRGDALNDAMAKPSKLVADTTCLECHTDVADERAESLHAAVSCMHCHGVGREHVEVARKAADSPDIKIPPAHDWDGDFLTKIDLFITQDRATCLVCHESAVGMPESFKKIDVAAHLEEQGADETTSREVCFECHGGHDTAP